MSTTEIPNVGKKTAIQKVSNSSIQSFKGMPSTRINEVLSLYQDSLIGLLKTKELAKRAIQIISTLVARNPQLQESSPSSIIGGMLQAAMLNLDFNPSLGLCYLVPYGKDAQFQLGYRGMVQLAHNGGLITDIYAEVVYEDDKFELEYGLNRTLKHVPDESFKYIGNSEKIRCVYAVAKTKSGGTFYVVLSKAQIEALRKRSPMQKYKLNGAWASDYAEMAKAKAVKQLFKYLPFSTENNNVFVDNAIIRQPLESKNISDMEIISEHEIEEAEILDPKPQQEISDEEWLKQNAEEYEKQLFEQENKG